MHDQTTTIKGMETKVEELLRQMTVEEKIGQLSVVHGDVDHPEEYFRQMLTDGRVGAIINQVDKETIDELQRIAKTESRLGIPLLVGRDIVHGFKTIFPIPLGQAASWNPDLIERAARAAAIEASRAGINWTYAPMLDIARDPRWGRIAESFGEDTYLASILGAAMVWGFQGADLASPDSIAACAKHFAGYGASEGGRDYNTTNIPENELRNVHLPPFKAAIDVGLMSIMASFSDLDGVPASANSFLLQQVLRNEWGYEGLVVSDWDSVSQLHIHGFTEDDKDSARQAANAGLDMEMNSRTYANHLSALVEEGKLPVSQLDAMVSNVLRLKCRLGLFENPPLDRGPVVSLSQSTSAHLATAKELASQSIVLLTNKKHILPLDARTVRSIAVIGPLADDGYEQMGTWIFDGDPKLSQTPLAVLREYVGQDTDVHYVRTMDTTRSRSKEHFDEALDIVKQSDVAILFLGEESILSGEAHCRAEISLPGNQEQLIEHLSVSGTPLILVLMAGRPLALENIVDRVDAILYAWHPGNMAGVAIVDLLLGNEAPSGKLPATFPRVTGQIPIYYAHKNTGRPPTRNTAINIDDIERGAPQHSVGNTSFHLDTDYTPLFVFGHGLSYTEFKYTKVRVNPGQIPLGGKFTVSAELTNAGEIEATEVAQLYIRDLVGSVTRPVKQLLRFQRCRLAPGETITVSFELTTDDLAFYGRDNRLVTEPGKFHAWIGGSSGADLRTEFEVLA